MGSRRSSILLIQICCDINLFLCFGDDLFYATRSDIIQPPCPIRWHKQATIRTYMEVLYSLIDVIFDCSWQFVLFTFFVCVAQWAAAYLF